MKIKFIFSLFFLFLLTGCWNYRELNQLAISTGIAVDKAEDGKYEVSVLISNAKKSQVSSKEGESQTIVYSDKGNTISEAIRNINLQLSKDIYIGHLTVIVINEEVAKDGLYPILDYFLRDPESVKRFFIVISHDAKASDVISTLSPLDAFPSQNIYFNLKLAANSQAVSPSITYSKFIENIVKPGAEATAPSILILGDAEGAQSSDSLQQSVPEAVLKLGNVAIFDDDVLVGYANEKESRGINVINNNVNNTTATFEYKSHYITVNLTNISTSKEANMVDDTPVVTIHYKADAAIRELSSSISVDEVDTIKDIESAIEDNVKSILNQAIDCAQKKYKSDIFGFGNLIYKKFPHYFLNINQDWSHDVFPNLKINYEVKVNLQTKGSLEQSIGGLQDEITN